MKIECPNSACKRQFEVPDNANPADVRCPVCGAPAKAPAAKASAAMSAPALAKPKPIVGPPATSTPSRLDLPPYLAIPTITDPNHAEIPPLDRFQVLHSGEELVKNYQIRVRRPKFPWIVAIVGVVPAIFFFVLSFFAAGHDREAETIFWVFGLMFLLVGLVSIGAFFLFRLRGHTFLYLTNQRVIVLELSQGTFAREQSVCHFSLEDICGFQLLAQRGLKKLFGLLLLKEMRTFYLGITTRTCMNVQIGAVNVRRSEFDPGRDAVALCGELDAKVLALNATLAR
jgi:hypothetical protein